MLDNLNKYQILLASKSPRRRELFKQLRLPFNVVNIGGLKEEYPDSIPATEVPQFLANRKADAYTRLLRDDEMLITADTLVILGDKIYGKPKDTQEAMTMLTELSGKTHLVVTGVAVSTKDRRTSFSTQTKVHFCELDEECIRYYVDNFSPLDKAGAYGIQEWIGCVGIDSIEGSYYNVMGLPVHRLFEELKLF